MVIEASRRRLQTSLALVVMIAPMIAAAQAKVKLEIGNAAQATPCAVPLTVTRLKGKSSPSARELIAPVLDLFNQVKSPRLSASATVTNASAFNGAKSIADSPPTLNVEATLKWADFSALPADSIVVRVAEQALTALVDYKPSGDDKLVDVCIDVTGLFPANNDVQWTKAPIKVAVPLADLKQIQVSERSDDRTVAITLEDNQQIAVAIEHLIAPSPLRVSMNLNEAVGCVLTMTASPNPPPATGARAAPVAPAVPDTCDPAQIGQLLNLTEDQRKELVAKCATAGVAALTQGIGKLFAPSESSAKSAGTKDKEKDKAKSVIAKAQLKVPKGAAVESVSAIHVRLGVPGQHLLGKAVLVSRSRP